MSLVSKSTQPYSRVDPRSVGNCALWLDAADSNTFTLSGSNVTQWRDKSCNSFHASGGVSPTRSGTSVVFNGTTQYLDTSLSANPSTITGETVFSVGTVTGPTGAIYSMIGGGTLSGRVLSILRSGGFTQVFYGTTGKSSDSGIFTPTTPTVYTGLWSGGSGTGGQVGINGSNLNGGVTGITFSNTFTRIGASGSTVSEFFAGSLNEILVYSNWLGTRSRQLVEGYLMNKWGIAANAPVTHPYRSLVPFVRRFLPTDVSGCVLWLDSADSNSLVLSTFQVQRWRDKSGFGNDASGGVSPIVQSNGISFDGANHYMVTPYSAILDASRGETVFAVVTPSSTSGIRSVIGPSTGNGRGFGISNFSSTVFRSAWQVSNTVFGTDTSGTVGARTLLTGGILATGDTAINGASLSVTGESPAVAWGGGGVTTIGAGAVGTTRSNYFQGTIHEILVYNLDGRTNNGKYDPGLTSNDILRVESYLATKWGLRTSVPSTHFANTIGTVGTPQY